MRAGKDKIRPLVGTPIPAVTRTGPSPVAIARVIGDVYLSNLVAWVTRRASADDVTSRLALAARLLLR